MHWQRVLDVFNHLVAEGGGTLNVSVGIEKKEVPLGAEDVRRIGCHDTREVVAHLEVLFTLRVPVIKE